MRRQRLNTTEAAAYLGCAATTVKTSRVTGTLLGQLAPTYRKIGRHVLYEVEELDRWIKQFPLVRNTADICQTPEGEDS